jgi:putative two-component system response regulator
VIFRQRAQRREGPGQGTCARAVDYITKPFSTPLVLARLRNHRRALSTSGAPSKEHVRQRTEELHTTRRQIIRRLSRAMEYREGGLTQRVLRVSHYVKALATEAGMDSDTVDILFEAVPLSTSGKIGVPDYILLKTII